MGAVKAVAGVMLVLTLGATGAAPARAHRPVPPGDERLRQDPYIRQEPRHVGVLKRVVPGLIGAIAGGYLGGNFGFVGRIVGGVAGWYIGNKVGKLLFPGRWYDDHDHYPWYYREQVRYSRQSGDSLYSFELPSVTARVPRSPVLDERLRTLRDEFNRTRERLQEALRSGTAEAQRTAQAALAEAAEKYEQVKRQAYGR
jgi:hypothetical protein